MRMQATNRNLVAAAMGLASFVLGMRTQPSARHSKTHQVRYLKCLTQRVDRYRALLASLMGRMERRFAFDNPCLSGWSRPGVVTVGLSTSS